ncbi:S24 family peptidase [Dyella marensis]|uniref:S24 family peptidase n=1 Tax=Dyella marensis TaxID=500610 RepID=UPI0031CE106C
MKPIKDLRRENFVKLMAEQGGQSAVAARIKRDRNQVYQWTLDPSNPASRGIGDKLARVIEQALQVPIGWLDADHPSSTNPPAPKLEAIGGEASPAAFRRVPITGAASLDLAGYWHDLDRPSDENGGYFEFHTKDPNAYALQVNGTAMSPAIRSGWYVIIEPGKPPKGGEFVLVKLKDGRSTLKEYLWYHDGWYTLSAISTNQDDRQVLRDTEIESVHHVAGILPRSGRII